MVLENVARRRGVDGSGGRTTESWLYEVSDVSSSGTCMTQYSLLAERSFKEGNHDHDFLLKRMKHWNNEKRVASGEGEREVERVEEKATRQPQPARIVSY